jgi:hypothetical protein
MAQPSSPTASPPAQQPAQPQYQPLVETLLHQAANCENVASQQIVDMSKRLADMTAERDAEKKQLADMTAERDALKIAKPVEPAK